MIPHVVGRHCGCHQRGTQFRSYDQYFVNTVDTYLPIANAKYWKGK